MRRAFLLGLLLLTAGPARGDGSDPAYAGLPAPVYEVYAALLYYADDAAFDRLQASLKHLDGLLRVIDGSCGSPLSGRLAESFRSGDAVLAREAIRELIAVDFQRHLAAAATGTNQRSTELQMAAALYALVSPAVRAGDSARDGRVRRALRDALDGAALDPVALIADLRGSIKVCQR